MSLAIIVGLPVLCAFGLLFWASMVSEKFPILALILQLMFLPLMFLSIHFGVEYLSLVYGADASFVETLGDFTFYLGWLLFIVGLYLLYEVVLVIVSWFIKRKNDKEAERYD